MEGMPALEGMMPQIPGGQPPPMPGGGMPAPGPVPSGGREQGTVSRWTERGFGFITPDGGGEDVFCHKSGISDGNALPRDGKVEYEVGVDSAGRRRPRASLSGARTLRVLQAFVARLKR